MTVAIPDGHSLLPLHGPALGLLCRHGISGGGLHGITRPFELPPRKIGHFLLCAVFVGATRHRLEGRDLDTAAGQVAILPPQPARTFAAIDLPVRLLWLNLDQRPQRAWLAELGPTVRPASQAHAMLAAMRGIITEHRQRGPHHTAALAAHARLLVIAADRELTAVRHPSACERDETLDRLWRAILDDPAHPWTVATMAAAVDVSPSRLKALVAASHSCGPGRRLAEMRLECGATLLTLGDDPLDAVARAVGYGCAYSFSNAFVRLFGLRPGEYRRRFRCL